MLLLTSLRGIRGVTTTVIVATTALLTVAVPPRPGTATPGAAGGETLARRYFEEVWNQGKVDVLEELLAPDYVNHTPSFGTPPPGPTGLKPIVLAMRRAFPDLHFTIEDVVVAPDAVAIRTTMTGTHKGDLFGISDAPPDQRDADPDRARPRRSYRRTLAGDR